MSSEGKLAAASWLLNLELLDSFSFWNEANARAVFINNAALERSYLKLDAPECLIHVGPLSLQVFNKLLETTVRRLDISVRNPIYLLKGGIASIPNYMPREFVNFIKEIEMLQTKKKEIGAGPLTVEDVKEKLQLFNNRRRDELYSAIENHYRKLPPSSQDGSRLALAKIFLPGKYRPHASFDCCFLDYGLVYGHEYKDSLSYSPTTPAAKAALLDLYKTCPLPEMYRKNLDGAGFEDVLFQQLIRSPGLVLQTTNLAGENPLDVDLGATGYELMQKPPRMLGRDGMGILVRCYVGYERFSFIQGYRFIQVSVRDFKTYDKESAMIELAFDKGPGAKNQIEEYLDAAFGGFHEAILIGRGIRKRFEVKKDGILRKDFKVIYICGRGDFGEGASGKHGLPNHKLKALEYPEVRHICFGELKQSDLAL